MGAGAGEVPGFSLIGICLVFALVGALLYVAGDWVETYSWVIARTSATSAET